MRIINMGRRCGKTVMLIHTAFVTGAPIVVENNGMKLSVKETAEKLRLSIDVYTCEEFRKIRPLNGPILIDESRGIIQRALEEYFNTSIIATTFTVPMMEVTKGGTNETVNNTSNT